MASGETSTSTLSYRSGGARLEESDSRGFPAARVVATIVLFLAGIALWLACDPRRWYSASQLGLLAVIVALTCLPAVNAWAGSWLDAIRTPTPSRRALIALGIAVATGLYLALLIHLERHLHFPHFHDESMHLIQAQLLSQGRLWAPPHAFPQFFETFFVFVTPVYAPMQFPGASLLYVPGIWIGWPYWVTSLLIASAAAGMMYRVVAQAIDGVAGVLAALWLIGSASFRLYGLMVLSNPMALLLGLGVVWAWLRWRERKTPGRCAIIGLLAGWAAITRPADALCFAIPVGVAMLFDLADETRADRGVKSRGFMHRVLASGAILVLSAAPFLGLQIGFNRGVTGKWLQTPHARYVELFNPSVSYGHGSESPARPATTLPQKIDYYDSFVMGHAERFGSQSVLRAWISQRLPVVLQTCLPCSLAIILVPGGLLGLRTRARWILVGVLICFVAFYSLIAIFAAAYSLIAAAAVVPLGLLGGKAIEEASGRGRKYAAPILTVSLAGIGILGMPSLRDPQTEQHPVPTLAKAEQEMAAIPGHAVVFCRYQHGDNLHEDPVFNTASADIDAARVVRAHDLGPAENIKLYEYYRQRQPRRAFYRFDRSNGTLTEIDPAAEFRAARRAAP